MEHRHQVEFKHRPRADGLFDSICLCCFHTVGTTDAESELRALEILHECEQRFIRSYADRKSHGSGSPDLPR
jgi:hypothetical protein